MIEYKHASDQLDAAFIAMTDPIRRATLAHLQWMRPCYSNTAQPTVKGNHSREG